MPPKGAISQPRQPLRSRENKTWRLPGLDEVFVQSPLTFFEKNEFFALVSRVIDYSMQGGRGINDLLQLLGTDDATFQKVRDGELSWDMLGAAEGALGTLTRLFSAAPGFMEELYFLILSVEPARQDEIRPALRKIDDDTGFGILDAFVDQNTRTIKDFLPRWRVLYEKANQELRGTTTPDA